MEKIYHERCRTGGTEIVCGLSVEFIRVDRAVIFIVDVDDYFMFCHGLR